MSDSKCDLSAFEGKQKVKYVNGRKINFDSPVEFRLLEKYHGQHFISFDQRHNETL